MAGLKGRSGRRKRETEQQMIDSLSVYTEDVYRVLGENIKKGKFWAIKIWFDRMYGKATERKDLTVLNTEQPLFNISLQPPENFINE